MSKIIFLDFDGVMNCRATKDRIVFPPWGAQFRGLDDEKVQLVSKLALESGASIVISSTWREFFKVEEMREILVKRGLDPSIPFVGQTPKIYSDVGFGFNPKRSERGDDIQAWLNENKSVTSFVVLDDLNTQFKDDGRQVQTKDDEGFVQRHYELALAILKGDD